MSLSILLINIWWSAHLLFDYDFHQSIITLYLSEIYWWEKKIDEYICWLLVKTCRKHKNKIHFKIVAGTTLLFYYSLLHSSSEFCVILPFQVLASIWKTFRPSELWKMNRHPADAQNFNILNNDKRAFY